MRSLKSTFAAAVAISAILGGAASAADLAAAPVYSKAPAVMPVYNWTGWYIGGNAGWVGTNNGTLYNSGTDTGTGGYGTGLANGAFVSSTGLSNSGFLGGGQFGYNYQSGLWLVGFEADFDGASAKQTTVINYPGVPFVPNTQTYSRELDWLGTVRARAGVVASPSLLLFGTGGLAYGQTQVASRVSCPTAGPSCDSEPTNNLSTSNTSVGWTAGAGFEWMFTPNWSVKGEYLYVDLGHHSNTLTYTYTGATSTLTSTVRDTYNIGRIGVNYHFGAPVVAKY
jgi:outer membrane immunogenic protein